MGTTGFNAADTAWVLTATALVLLMTLPGLALFYGGLVRGKNALSVLMQCFAITCVTSILWLIVGYSLTFGNGGALQSVVGGLDRAMLAGMDRMSLVGTLPEPLFFMFQLTFAIITPALVIGGYAERIRFSVVLWFSALWLLLVYVPVAHWIWGGGWLAQLGVMDFAGGIVVHVNAGVAALVCALVVGRRRGFPEVPTVQGSILAQLGVQALGIAAAAVWCAVLTWLIVKVLGATLGLRVSDEQESEGLDLSEHGERGYSP